ncbi:hypothetical protein FACS189430_02950 [Bacteroidia bacterium]|nr:hypothetical protein FACS189430_02950 [Bacteroidia bacterium]
MKKVILPLILCLFGIVNVFAQFSGGGTGTVADPYILKTAEDLDNVRNFLGTSHNDKHFRMANDIDLTDFLNGNAEGWLPLGDNANRFTGYFDGDNHKVTGLRIDRTTMNLVGLFSYNDGTIENVGVAGGLTIKGRSVGGLVGSNNNGTIKGCYAGVMVYASDGYSGGLIGSNYQGTITNCYATGNASSTFHSGGLIGHNDRGTITNCYATGNASSTSVSNIGASSGGLIGMNRYGAITNCYATGNASSTTTSSSTSTFGFSSNSYSGGLIGQSDYGTITNCYATGNASSSSSSSSSHPSPSSPSSSYSSFSYSGGLIGHCNGAVSRCYATGNAFSSSIASSYSSSYSGGLIGYTDNNATATNCYALGNSTSPNGDSRYSGGLIGYMSVNSVNPYTVLVRNCYSAGTASGTSNHTGAFIGGGSSSFNPVNFSICYYNTDITGALASAGNSIPCAVGLTTAEMRTQSSFVSWYFGDIWSMSDITSVNLGYPELASTFSLTKVSITATAGANGSISPSGNVLVDKNGNKTFTITPSIGYETDEVLIDGVNNATAVSAGSYTFNNVTANHTIAVSFKPASTQPPTPSQYTIISMATAGGSITPSGIVTVNKNEEQIFGILPENDYEIDMVLIDGINNETAVSTGSFTFANVTANHTIAVSFKPASTQPPTPSQYTIISMATAGGSITPSGIVTVNKNGEQIFGILPENDYEIDMVLLDGINNETAVSTSSFTFTNVTANHTIAVSFKPTATTPATQYMIVAMAGAGGSISPSGVIMLNPADNQSFVITPAEGYETEKVLIDGINNETAVSTGSFTFTNVTANHTVMVSFRKTDNGAENPVSDISVDGGALEFNAAASSYRLLLDCGQTAASISLSAASASAVITIDGEAFGNTAFKTLTMPAPGSRTLTITIQDGNSSKNYFFELVRPFENVIIQRWDDVLSVVNNPANNGGYTFVQYQWYRDGKPIHGAIEGYIRETGGLNASSVYYAMLQTSTGIEAPSCLYNPAAGSKAPALAAYPNPIASGQAIQVEVSLPENEYSSAVLTLFDISGKPVRKEKAVQGSNIMAAPASTGVYVLSLSVAESETATVKIVVQ